MRPRSLRPTNARRGTCCPFGERQQDQQVDGDASGFLGRCFQGSDGCVCDNGWAGLACTCPATPDLASGLQQLPQTAGYGFSVDLGQRFAIDYAVVLLQQNPFLPSGCTPLGVGVTDSLTLVPTPCLPAADGRWNCPPPSAAYDGFGRFIVVDTAEQFPLCSISVFSDSDPPCGPHGNPFAGRFYAIEGKRSPLLYIDPQPIEFSPYGCTHSACMCNVNYTGPACAAAVSSYSVSVTDGQVYPLVCGESLFGPRGALGPDGQCVCNALSAAAASGVYGSVADNVDAVFAQQACACPAFWLNGTYQLCAGRGVCVEPSFEYGRCSLDLARIAADPLATPFVVAPAQSVLPRTFVFEDNETTTGGDPRSVMAVNGECWLLPPLTQLIIPTLQNSFAVCSLAMEFPLNVTFTCSVSYQNPVRGWALQSVYSLSGNTTQQCDPAVTSPAAPNLNDGRLVSIWMTPPTVFLPNRVPCGPFSTSTSASSPRSLNPTPLRGR